MADGRNERIWLAVILVVGALLRFHDLGNGLWLDEIVTMVRYATLPASNIVTLFDSQNNHVLYSLMAHSSMQIVGETVIGLRLPAVVFGVASLWAVYWFAKSIGRGTEGLIAAGFLTVSYHHVWFSQNARGYTALMFFTLVGTGLLVRMLDTGPKRSTVLAYGGVMALAVYTHLTGLLIVVSHGAVLLFLLASGRGDRGTLRAALAGVGSSMILSLLLYLPVLGQVARVFTSEDGGSISTIWSSGRWFFRTLFGGLGQSLPGGGVTVVVALVIISLGLGSLARKTPRALALMLGPVVLTGVALIVTEHNLWPRFFFFAVGFASIIAVRGGFVVCGWLAPPSTAPRLATAGAGVLMLLSLLMVPKAWAPKQDFIGAMEWVESNRDPDDAVVTLGYGHIPFEEYLHAGWLWAADEQELESIESRHPRTWVVYFFPGHFREVQPRLYGRLEQDYTPAQEFSGTVRGGSVLVRVSRTKDRS